ncbi:hypothetical protein RA27_09595 [Ruegeria sp. ANG-R]|nr:hypothetical protein RA27_09595 [Ruegeria sp. ANG-R]
MFSISYAAFAAVLALLVRENAAILLDLELTKLLALTWQFINYLKLLGIAVLVFLYFSRHSGLRARIVRTLYAFFGCLLFCAAFSITKTSIPYLMPFYADEILANIDNILHFGVDPWEIAHRASAYVTPSLVETIYFTIWILPAFFLPVIIALTDESEARRNRFMILYCTCWILLGNVLALVFSSVGPIYYDLLLGGDRFAGLSDALGTSGLTDSKLGKLQTFLWHDYVSQAQTFGSGISAFPSVHVGVAMVVALYMAERSMYLLIPGLVFLIAVLFCSVFNGWHYAIDGYVSIGVIAVAWILLRHRISAVPKFAPTRQHGLS